LLGEPTKHHLLRSVRQTNIKNNICVWSGDIKSLCELIITNKSKLETLKIETELWLYYIYEEQCNLEFSSVLLQLISESGVHFCVSCIDSVLNYNK
jgi:hypothetical protein